MREKITDCSFLEGSHHFTKPETKNTSRRFGKEMTETILNISEAYEINRNINKDLWEMIP